MTPNARLYFVLEKHIFYFLLKHWVSPKSLLAARAQQAMELKGFTWSYPCRYSDLIPRFGRPVPVLSMINNTVLDFIYNAHSHRITQWNHSILERYANAVSDKGAALDNCIGFIGGTVRPICRPGEL